MRLRSITAFVAALSTLTAAAYLALRGRAKNHPTETSPPLSLDLPPPIVAEQPAETTTSVPEIEGSLSRILRQTFRLIQLLAALLLVFGVMLLALELLLRFYLERFGSEVDKARYLYTADDIRRPHAVYRGLPYLNYGLEPAHPEHNSLGFRGPEIAQPKPEGVYRIVAIGASTTQGFGIKHNEDTYPAQLQRILRDEYGFAQVEVINAGVPAYTSWENLVNLQFRILDLSPDLILIYQASNDIDARLVPPELYDGLNISRGIWNPERPDLLPSALLRVVGIGIGLMDDPSDLRFGFDFAQEVESCPYHVRIECHGYLVEDLLELNPPIYFERNLRNMIAVAQANKVRAMLSSWAFSTLPLENPPTPELFNLYTLSWRQDAAREHNAITQQVAIETGTLFYDLAANLSPEGNFWWDGYHQNEAGAREQASQYAAFIVLQGLLSSDEYSPSTGQRWTSRPSQMSD